MSFNRVLEYDVLEVPSLECVALLLTLTHCTSHDHFAVANMMQHSKFAD